ncbi:MAG: glycerol dehydrogenase [Eubacterium sp.]|nr:glycerol dehydrogenase [Eubacterium sp.]
MKKVIRMPGKYIQGEGVIQDVGEYAKPLGTKPALVWGSHTRAAVAEPVLESLKNHEINEYFEIHFNGESSHEEIARLQEEAKSAGCDYVIGFGGGKALDSSRAMASRMGVRYMIVPTIASNDSPTSACAVYYNEEHECIGNEMFAFNPDVVLIDTGIIVKAPARYMAAGIGDALATWLEANSSYKNRGAVFAGGGSTMTAQMMSKLCFDTIMGYGKECIEAVKCNVVTAAVEKVVESTTLLSGIGWESGGLTCAHAVANSLPVLHETHDFLHGEKVSFGIIVQLMLDEDMTQEEIYRIVDFEIDMGLPVTFDDLGLKDQSLERMQKFGEHAVKNETYIQTMYFPVTASSMAGAMMAANSLGKRRKALKGIK